jgi:hypothetical protein
VNISRERLLGLSAKTEFQSATLEKSLRLLGLLKEMQEHRDLMDRLALKGGTAINLFYFDAPRLSVDIDLNYIGAPEKQTMEQDRPRVEKAVEQIFKRAGMEIDFKDTDTYASSQWKVQNVRKHFGLGQASEV